MARRGTRRLGAYVLAADPTWLRSSLARYYDQLDVLLVSAAADNLGWTGKPIRADECVDLARSVDTRGIVRVQHGRWRDTTTPMVAETRQRQDALAELVGEVDWVLQLDGDEVLPSLDALLAAVDKAEVDGIDAVEWPMRVLYRRLRDGRYLEVTAVDGQARFEYPGPVAVRPTVRLSEARRVDGPFLRPIVVGDDRSTQLVQAAGDGEVRIECVAGADAILHNSWARDTRTVAAKIRSWGHNDGLRSWIYFARYWLVAPLRWRRMRNFHPFFGPLWPALSLVELDVDALVAPVDR